MTLRIATGDYFDSLKRFEKHLPPGKDETELILKGHLLIERMLERYFETHCSQPSEIRGARLSFYQKVCVVASMHPHDDSAWLWEACRALNRLRNELAHELESKKLIGLKNQFIDLVSESVGLPGHEPREEVEDPLHRAIFAVHECLSFRVDL